MILNWGLSFSAGSARKRESLPLGIRHQFIGITMPSKYSKLRTSAAKKQQHRCYYCNAPMWSKDSSSFVQKHRLTKNQANRFQCTAEHLDARCDGGQDIQSNIVAACRSCNQGRHQRKEDMTPAEYLSLVAQRIKKGKWHPNGLSRLSVSK